MTRLEELTLQLADDALTDDDQRELESLMAAEPRAVATHQQLLALEVALRGQRETLDLAGPTMARLCSDLAMSVERGVMQRLESEPPPAWATPRSHRRKSGADDSLLRRASVSFFRQLGPPWNRLAVLAFAVSVMLMVGLGNWLFGPKMGQPTLAGMNGAEVFIQRGTEYIPAVTGMSLQAADVVRVGTNAAGTISFGAERTRFELGAGTQLKILSWAKGKRLELHQGRLEATVARQQPLLPMILTSAQAEARVLGTRFTLVVSPDATRLDVTEGKVRFTRVSDGEYVNVTADRYAVVADNFELATLPRTGGLLYEWWNGVAGQTQFALNEDPRFPHQPDGRGRAPEFALTLGETNRYGARLYGYLHPPVTGDYEFWLETELPISAQAALLLSPGEDSTEAVGIAAIGTNSNQAPPPIPLVAGRRYFVEAYVLIPSGGGRFSIAWKPPGGTRQVITGEFLSPAELAK